jgi:hypothetical protein
MVARVLRKAFVEVAAYHSLRNGQNVVTEIPALKESD